MKVLIIGSSQKKHVKKIYESCGWSCIELEPKKNKWLRICYNIGKIIKSDMIYTVGGVDVNKSRFLLIAKFFKKRIVIHWIGTDVLKITEMYQQNPSKTINNKCINISGSPILCKELSAIGINSTIIPIVPTDIQFEPVVMPKEHGVIAYIPEERENFYGLELLKNIASHFDDTMFYIVANRGDNDKNPLQNIIYLGMLNPSEMKRLYRKCSILFRYPEHDGLSMMVLEALGLGRSVIYKYEFPFVEVPASDSLSDIIITFNKILKKPPILNIAAIEYINTEFSLEKQISRYKVAKII